MHALILRLEAPLVAFGGVAVDENGVVTRFPGRSLLTGLFANALGWDQSQVEEHQALQTRLSYAVRIDAEGLPLVDFQTVDLGQPHLANGGWTTRGQAEFRKGGTAASGTHIRRRHYRADARYVVAVTLSPAEGRPDLHMLEAALDMPARPLFIGRKSCLPSVYLKAGVVEAPNLTAALAAALPAGQAGLHPALWPMDDPGAPLGRPVTLADDRDWRNQVHTGRRTMREGLLAVEGRP